VSTQYNFLILYKTKYKKKEIVRNWARNKKIVLILFVLILKTPARQKALSFPGQECKLLKGTEEEVHFSAVRFHSRISSLSLFRHNCVPGEYNIIGRTFSLRITGPLLCNGTRRMNVEKRHVVVSAGLYIRTRSRCWLWYKERSITSPHINPRDDTFLDAYEIDAFATRKISPDAPPYLKYFSVRAY